MNVAAIDIGTNSVRLLITDASGKELVRLMHITRLGQGVDITATLHSDAIARTTAVLAAYRNELVQHDVSRVRATATSAARDAKNSAQFFDQAEQALGHRPELLSGEEEALLSFQGATSGLSNRFPAPYLVIDIGGGSTEFVLGETAPEQLISTNMGCVRMVERHFHDDPPTQAQLDACCDDVREQLVAVRASIDVARARTVIGVAGTVTTLASLAQNLTVYDPAKTHRARLSLAQVEALYEKLAHIDVTARRRLLTEPRRAEVIVGGASLLLTLMRELSIQELIASETDILDGLAASLRT